MKRGAQVGSRISFCLIALIVLLTIINTGCGEVDASDLNQVIQPDLPERFSEEERYGSPVSLEPLPIPLPEEKVNASAGIDLGRGYAWIIQFQNQNALMEYYQENYDYVSENAETNDQLPTYALPAESEIKELEELGEKAFTRITTTEAGDYADIFDMEDGATFTRIYFYRCNMLVLIWLYDPFPSRSTESVALDYARVVDERIEISCHSEDE